MRRQHRTPIPLREDKKRDSHLAKSEVRATRAFQQRDEWVLWDRATSCMSVKLKRGMWRPTSMDERTPQPVIWERVRDSLLREVPAEVVILPGTTNRPCTPALPNHSALASGTCSAVVPAQHRATPNFIGASESR